VDVIVEVVFHYSLRLIGKKLEFHLVVTEKPVTKVSLQPVRIDHSAQGNRDWCIRQSK
jgi:hypothetical protein